MPRVRHLALFRAVKPQVMKVKAPKVKAFCVMKQASLCRVDHTKR